MLSLDGITKSFGGLRAVDRCSFEIGAGRITALIGPNGAGKSTLFDIIAGVTRPDAGRVRLGQRDVTGLPPHRLFGLGLVRTFQTPHEFARLTVRENLMVVPAHQSGERLLTSWLRWGKVADEERRIGARVAEVLEFLQLGHLAGAPAGSLSGGQKKLLELGRTMMAEPRVVLLDEPGAGVNPALLGKLTAAIRRINAERGVTFCIVEHDMDLVARLCHPIVVMAQGRVLAQGSMQEIRANEAVREAYLGGTVQDLQA